MKNYLIVGGSSAIGKELTKILTESGAKVYATYHQNKPEESSSDVEYHQVNVLDDQPKLDFLPEEIDGVVYCPGSINLKPFKRLKPEDFTADFELQVNGAVKVLQASVDKMKKSDDASIVLFSTVAVQMGFNFHTQVAASKGAIEGLTRSLAAELAPRIRVNAIAPSIVDTPLASNFLNTDEKKDANAKRHPMKRIGQSKDIAEMAAFLLSEKSSWITGQIMPVDGGISSIKS